MLNNEETQLKRMKVKHEKIKFQSLKRSRLCLIKKMQGTVDARKNKVEEIKG